MLMTRVPLKCFASASSNFNPKPVDNPITIARKTFETKRAVTLKENFNKLIAIGSAEAKELSDFAKELDELHKAALSQKKKSNDSVISVDADNIFLDQQ